MDRLGGSAVRATMAAEGEALDNEQIQARIFEAIVECRLHPGAHLKEDALCDIFGIGRTRVRAILARLAADHIIEHVPNRGAFVSTPTIEEAREVFRARRLLEGHLVRRLAENPGPATRAALGAHLDHEHATRSGGAQGMVIRCGGSFHQIVAEQAESPIMARFLNELIARSSLIVAIYESMPPDHSELAEHRRLTELLLAGHGEEAAAVMEAHIQGLEGRLDLRPRRAGPDDLRGALLPARPAGVMGR